MTNVIGSEDCGNSPKNIFVQDLTIAFATGDIQFILDRVTDDIVWEVVGRMRIQGKKEFAESLEQVKKDQVAEIAITHVVTHGKAGAVNGATRLEDGQTRAFANIYEFQNSKGERVKTITSYVIDGSVS